MLDQIKDREFLLASPASSGRRVKLSDNMTDEEIIRWEVSHHNGKDFLVLHGHNSVLCHMTYVASEGKYIGRDVRGGTSTLTPIQPVQSASEGVSSLMGRIAKNSSKPKEDDMMSSQVTRPWMDGYADVDRQVDSFEKTSNSAIAVVGCNRPDYMRKVLEGLAKNDLSNYDVYLFLDKPPIHSEHRFVADQIAAARTITESACVAPFNFGCGQWLIEVRRQMFDRMGYDKVFVFEDDMVPSSNYIAYCENLLDWGQSNYTNVGAVQGWHKCTIPASEKASRTRQVHATFTNWWGYLMTRESWDQISATLYEYRNVFLQKAYKVRPSIPILEYFRTMAQRNFHLTDGGFQPDEAALRHRRNLFNSPPTGQDGATWLAFDNANLVRLGPTVNRGLYIGEHGIHSTAEIFRKDRFDRMTLEEYADDEDTQDFEPRG